MKLTLLILTSSLLIIGTELLKRRFSISSVFTRRFIHIGTAVIAAIAPLFVSREQIIIVSLIFAGILLVGRAYNLFSAVHSVERRTLGEVYLPLGVALTAFFFLPNNLHGFQFGVFIMGISDALGGLVGDKFGKHRLDLFGISKTLEGSLAFFASSLAITFLFFPVFGYELFLVPAFLTLIEFSLIYGLDNLILPLLGALLSLIFS